MYLSRRARKNRIGRQHRTFDVGSSRDRASVRGGGANSILIRRLLQTIIAFYFLVQLSLTLLLSEFQPTPIDEVLALTLVVWAGQALYSNTPLVRKIALLFSCYCGFTVVGVVINGYQGVPQPLSMIVDVCLDAKPFVIMFGVAFVFSRCSEPDLLVRYTAVILMGLALINAPFVIYDLMHGNVGFRGVPLDQRFGFSQPMGLQLHKTRSVWVTSIGAFSAAYLAASQRSAVALFVSVFLAILGVLHFSVKETIALLLVLGVIALYYGKGRYFERYLMFSVVALILIGILFLSPVGEIIVEQIDRYIGSSALDKARYLISKASIDIAIDNFPIGSGAGTFASPPSYQYGYSWVYVKYGLSSVWGASPNNSSFLQDVFWAKVIGQSGFLGACCYLSIIIILLRNSVRRLACRGGPRDLLIFAVTIYTIAVSLASSPFGDEFIGVVFAFFSGIGLAITPPDEQVYMRRFGGGSLSAKKQIASR